jgi:hypothetical protein
MVLYSTNSFNEKMVKRSKTVLKSVLRIREIFFELESSKTLRDSLR